MFERILVPLDGSAAAESLLPMLDPALRSGGAELTLTRIVDLEWIPTAEYAKLRTYLPHEAGEYLAKVKARLEAAGLKPRTDLREGRAAEKILEVAKDARSTLIAMATHGRSGILRWTLGSVTEKVLRASEVPVLAWRPPEKGGAAPFRKVLVAIDGSECSLEALPAAAAFARKFGSSIVVITVEEPSTPHPEHVPSPAPLRQPITAAADHARLAQGRLNEQGMKADVAVLAGDPATQLVDSCSRLGADLLVLSTHGRSGPSRWVLGSVAEKVLRAAPVPLLVVRNRAR